MFKPCITFLLVILFFSWNSAFGQGQDQLYNIYIKTIVRYEPVSSYTNEQYIAGHELTDSINIQVKSADDIQQIINSGLRDNIRCVDLQNTDELDLDKIFNLLSGLPKLTFLKIDDWAIGKNSAYQLPADIAKLQQLKGIEFRSTDKLDMDDALKKTGSLKKLQVLLFTSYKYQLPETITELKNVAFVELSPDNIENIDVSKTNWQFVELNGFDGSYNSTINEKALLNLSRINSLQRLDLSMFFLKDATVLTQLKQINTLNLYGSPVPPGISLFTKVGELKNLRSLLIGLDSNNNISLDGIEGLTNLQSLTISGLFASYKNPEQLIILNALKDLRSLSIQNIGLTAIPDIFKDLKQLKSVSLADNQLSQLPKSLFNLPYLEYLNVSGNKLTILPDSQNYGCKNLKTLILSINELNTLPTAITRLTQLEKLDATNNNIKTTPQGLSNLKKLNEINLRANRLTIFPGDLQQMPGLEKIDVSDNDISFMADITGNNYRLKSLSVNGNKLISLPRHLGKYTELEFLNAGGNSLLSLPQSLGACKKLKYLSVYSYNWNSVFKAGWEFPGRIIKDSTKSNNIKALPSGLKDAKDLEFLFLSGNPSIDSKSVFDVILSTPRKRFKADLSRDNITALPASPQWANMTFDRLDLSYNKLTTLPAEFTKVKVYNIKLDHNSAPLTLKNIAK